MKKDNAANTAAAGTCRHVGKGVVVSAVGSDARVRVYRLRPERFQELQRWLRDLEAYWASELDAFKEHAERTRGRGKRRR